MYVWGYRGCTSCDEEARRGEAEGIRERSLREARRQGQKEGVPGCCLTSFCKMRAASCTTGWTVSVSYGTVQQG